MLSYMLIKLIDHWHTGLLKNKLMPLMMMVLWIQLRIPIPLNSPVLCNLVEWFILWSSNVNSIFTISLIVQSYLIKCYVENYRRGFLGDLMTTK